MTERTRTEFVPPNVKGYELVRLMGRGEWTPVYLYRNRITRAEYAFKFLDPSELARRQIEERRLTDGELWAKESLGGNTRSLPNVAYGSVEYADDGTPFLREEPIDRFLSDYLKNSTPTIEEIVQISRGLASGLKGMHKVLGRAHSDLQPANIGYITDGEVKISDFGASTVGDHDRRNVGFLGVRAPERFGNGEAEVASDIWSFGSVLYRMFTGEYVFEREFGMENLERFIETLYLDRGSWNAVINQRVENAKRIPGAFRDLLKNCLHDEDGRIQNGEELSIRLEKAVREYERSRPIARGRRWGIIAASLLSLGSLARGYFHLDSERRELENKVNETQERLSLQRKQEIIKLYLQRNREYHTDVTNFLGEAKLSAWIDRFGDTRTAIAAYINPEILHRAVRVNGGKTDYETLEPIIKDMDTELYLAVHSVGREYIDSWMYSIRRDMPEEIESKWQQMDMEYDDEVDSLTGREPSKIAEEIGLGLSQAE